MSHTINITKSGCSSQTKSLREDTLVNDIQNSKQIITVNTTGCIAYKYYMK